VSPYFGFYRKTLVIQDDEGLKAAIFSPRIFKHSDIYEVKMG